MRERKAARLLVVNPVREVLLFRFRHHDDALAGQHYWATPGGGLEDGETFQAAALRELREETGIRLDAVSDPVAHRRFAMRLPSGERVLAVEQYFLLHVQAPTLCQAEWTAHEKQVMGTHHWWSAQELASSEEQIWPQGMLQMLTDAGVFEPAA